MPSHLSVRHLVLGILLDAESRKESASLSVSPVGEIKKKRRNSCEIGSHVHILNWALHLDESTPHIHERHVFDCENQYGEIAPQQEKAWSKWQHRSKNWKNSR